MKRTLTSPGRATKQPAEIQISFTDASLDMGLYVPSNSTQRTLGAYYTPGSAADYMAEWVVRHDEEHVLEPSVGDGIFFRAIEKSAARKNFTAISLTGVEIDENARARALQERLIADVNVRHADFLSVAPFKVQAVIGNPPYVRLRHLDEDQRQRALRAAQVATGQAMDPAGSLWMPFVLHAMRFLDTDGRLAFVLPYDFTYVRYAQSLWKVLSDNFGSLHVMRTHERLFPDLLQDVVILLADNYGSRTDTIRYQAFERVDDLLNMRPIIDTQLDVHDLCIGKRAFVAALLGDELRHLLSTRVAEMTVQARKLVTFNIGYVAGDKVFFHPADSDVHIYQIPAHSLRPTLTSARRLKGAGLRTSSLGSPRMTKLFFPNPSALTQGERRYIAMGKERGIADRYKCRIRHPWFIVPGTRIPDLVLSVFTECPVLLVNDAHAFASNSFLCGYRRGATSEEIATSWYTSLTLLQCELEVHALGGGVMIMVPNEAGNIRLPKSVCVREEHLSHLDHLLRLGRTTAAYQYGDQKVLIEQLGLSQSDVDLVRHGVEVLTRWRTSAHTSVHISRDQ